MLCHRDSVAPDAQKGSSRGSRKLPSDSSVGLLKEQSFQQSGREEREGAGEGVSDGV
jgi:hypothetical protein